MSSFIGQIRLAIESADYREIYNLSLSKLIGNNLRTAVELIFAGSTSKRANESVPPSAPSPLPEHGVRGLMHL